MTTTFGPDPVRKELAEVLQALDRGETVDGAWERQRVDLKEEAGRRDKSGVVGPGTATNEAAAEKLAEEAACMANTPGGGALIVGVADDGTLVGAGVDDEWLRHRIYELTQRQLTVDVAVKEVQGFRLLTVVMPTAIEPIRMNGKIRWRVGDHCVEVDAATWHARRMMSLNYDWSAEESTVPATAVRPQALALAREFLLDSGDASAIQLAAADDRQLLRRLGAVTGQEMLTNAAVLVFVGRDQPAMDYVHRDYAGGDSTSRVRLGGRSLLEELQEVFRALDAHNATRHLQSGLSIGQVRDIPPLAAREAIVNGLAHREWGVSEPTTVEHVGRTLRITSPGGFFGGVNPQNIITHPSQSRNRTLTQLLADLKVAEREGIGVDRMIREMLRLGDQPPDFSEVTGPFVRTSLIGDSLDESWIAWLGTIRPLEESQDVNSLLLLRDLVTVGWIDAARSARLIQLTVEEARGAIAKLARASMQASPVLLAVGGVPDGTEPVWRLHPDAARLRLSRAREYGYDRHPIGRAEIARTYAQARGRISTTELGSLVGASPTNVGSTLKALESEGLLAPSSETRRGRGFYYTWVGDRGGAGG